MFEIEWKSSGHYSNGKMQTHGFVFLNYSNYAFGPFSNRDFWSMPMQIVQQIRNDRVVSKLVCKYKWHIHNLHKYNNKV